MKKLELRLNREGTEDWFDENGRLEWRHVNVEVSLGWHVKILKCLVSIDLSHVRKFTLGSHSRLRARRLTTILSRMPHLEELNLNVFHFFDPDGGAVVAFQRLKSLQIYSTRALQLIDCQGLEELIVSAGDCSRILSDNPMAIVEFLMRHHTANIKKLSLPVDNYAEYLQHQDSFDFQLTHFEIIGSFHIDPQSRERLGNLLSKYASTLESLGLHGAIGIGEENHLKIFCRLPHLTSLKLEASDLPKDAKFYRKLKPITTLKNLVLSSSASDSNIIQKILVNCPNLERLALNWTENQLLLTVITFNPKLRSLGGTFCTDIETDHIRRISQLPNFDTFELELVPLTRKQLRRFLRPTLRHLIIRTTQKGSQRVFDTLMENLGNLKTLKLQKNIEAGFEVFKFPSNRALLDIEGQREKLRHLYASGGRCSLKDEYEFNFDKLLQNNPDMNHD